MACGLDFWQENEKFQSLFCWRRDSDPKEVLELSKNIELFQSLFCWRRDSDYAFFAVPDISQKVSILVLLEKGFRLGFVITAIFTKKKFQSLFCWRRDSDKTMIYITFFVIIVSILVLLEKGFRLLGRVE